MLQRTWRKLAINLFKYLPIVTAGIMVVHVALLLLGINLGFAESICGLSILPLIIAYAFSKGFGFCRIHRMFIDYTAKIFFCIQWQLWLGFGSWLTMYRVLMLILGIGLFIYFFTKIKEFVNCNPVANKYYDKLSKLQ